MLYYHLTIFLISMSYYHLIIPLRLGLDGKIVWLVYGKFYGQVPMGRRKKRERKMQKKKKKKKRKKEERNLLIGKGHFHLFFYCRWSFILNLFYLFLGEFQGPALVAILEGASLSREELSGLQLLPPWRLRGDTLNYGLGLLSCYSISDLLSIVSGGYYYIFDPHGLALPAPSSHGPTAKVFSLIGIFLLIYLTCIRNFHYFTFREVLFICIFVLRWFFLLHLKMLWLWL